MSLLQKFLALAMATCTTGLAGAGPNDPARDASHAAAADHGSQSAAPVPDSYSFEDILNLPSATERHLPADGILGRASGETLSEMPRIDQSMRALPVVTSNLDAPFDELSSHASGDRTAGPISGVELFPTDEIPEPSGWMLLLSGLAVAGFMARRKRRPSAG